MSNIKRQLSPLAFRIVLLYVFFVLMSVLLTVHSSKLAGDWGLGTIDTGDISSFLASVWASVFVAVIIGLGTAIWSLRTPDQDALDQRIGYLFSRRDLPKGTLEHFRSEVRELAAVGRDGEIVFRVREFDESRNAYRIRVQSDLTVINAMTDIDLDHDLRIWITPDPIDTEILGELEDVRLWKSGKDGRDRSLTLYHGESQRILHRDKALELRIPLTIERHAEVHLHYVFWAWCEQGREWTLSHDRFVTNVSVRIRNELENQDVCVSTVTDDYGKAPEVSKPKSLRSGGSAELFKGVTLNKKRSRLALILQPPNPK